MERNVCIVKTCTGRAHCNKFKPGLTRFVFIQGLDSLESVKLKAGWTVLIFGQTCTGRVVFVEHKNTFAGSSLCQY